MVSDPNNALKNTLSTYVKSEIDPQYAILLTGSWGVGKTFLIEQMIKEGIGDVKPIYVSLFGVSSKEDFDNALIAAVYPFTDNKIAKLGANVGSAVAGMFRFKLDMKPSDVFETIKSGVFIFDDLERISDDIKLQTVMGYLNKYIEHAGCRVILICNDEEIKDREAFARTKEKLVGRTLRVKPATARALTNFLNDITDKSCRKFLKDNRILLERIYAKSQVNNLRILKQALWDIEQLFSCLEKKHKSNKDALFDVLRLFFMFALEAKKGTLTSEELSNRQSGLIAAARRNDQAVEKTTIENLNDKYPEIYAYDTILTSDVLKAMIFDGEFSKAEIVPSLEMDRRFIEPEDEPEWKTVWYGTLRDEGILENAAKKMEKKYQKREYENSYVLLHVFTQRLWLASIGYLNYSEEEIIESAKSYIDGLLKDNLLEPYDSHIEFSRDLDSYDGLGFSGKEKAPFKNVAEYLIEKRKEAFKKTLVNESPNILKLMKDDINSFVTKLLPYQGRESEFGHHPILAETSPDDFLEVLFDLPANDQHEVFMLFSNRYKHNLLDTDLAPEKEWFETLAKKLSASLKDKSIFVKDRFKCFIRWYVKPVLEKNEQTET